MSEHTPYFVKAYNSFLTNLRGLRKGAVLPTEMHIAEQIGASRFTVRKVLNLASERKLIDWNGRHKTLRRAIRKADLEEETAAETSKREQVLNLVINLISSGDLQPGAHFSETRIAKEADTTLATVRDALPRLSELGIIRKEDRRQWQVIPITDQTIDELIEFRTLLETHGVRAFCGLSASDTAWQQLQEMREEHEKLLAAKPPAWRVFNEIDIRFHKLVLGATGNRFITSASNTVYFIIQLQRERLQLHKNRMKLGLSQHMEIIDALQARDRRQSVAAMRRHMKEAKNTLRRA